MKKSQNLFLLLGGGRYWGVTVVSVKNEANWVIQGWFVQHFGVKESMATVHMEELFLPSLLFPLVSSVCYCSKLLSCLPCSLLIKLFGWWLRVATELLWGCFSVGLLHSDQILPGIPEQPGSTVGIGPSEKQYIWVGLQIGSQKMT